MRRPSPHPGSGPSDGPELLRRYDRALAALRKDAARPLPGSATARFVQAAEERFEGRFVPQRRPLRWIALPVAAAAALLLVVLGLRMRGGPGGTEAEEARRGGSPMAAGPTPEPSAAPALAALEPPSPEGELDIPLRVVGLKGGRATISSPSLEARAADLEQALAPGSVVETPAGGSLTLEEPDTASLGLAEATSLRIERWTRNYAALDLRSGSLRSQVKHRGAGQGFEVRTPYVVVKVVGTEFITRHATGRSTEVEGISGLVRVESHSGELLATVAAGQMVRVSPSATAETRDAGQREGARAELELTVQQLPSSASLASAAAERPAPARRRPEPASVARPVRRRLARRRLGSSPARSASQGGRGTPDGRVIATAIQEDHPQLPRHRGEDPVSPRAAGRAGGAARSDRGDVASALPAALAPVAAPEPEREVSAALAPVPAPSPKREAPSPPTVEQAAAPLEAAAAPAPPLALRARRLLASGEVSAALALLEQGAPDDWRHVALRGDALRAKGDLPAAARDYARALRLAGAEAPARRLADLAQVREELGRRDEAAETWARYLRSAPRGVSAPRALWTLALRSLRVGEGQGYEAQLRDLLQRFPRSPQADAALARLSRRLIESRRWAEAERLLTQRPLEEGPRTAETALVGLLRLRVAQGRRADALDLVKRYREGQGARRRLREVEHLEAALK